ncbi:hypothetical protein SDC9_147027 [bioreactor metagenome]|uniref:Uncharacterized protein n=1 Tax=bioreactor metagenome TaxID=1076179 RepID=A0A645EGV8_9ZZZZ
MTAAITANTTAPATIVGQLAAMNSNINHHFLIHGSAGMMLIRVFAYNQPHKQAKQHQPYGGEHREPVSCKE